MKKLFKILAGIFIFNVAHTQYYYNDVISNKQNNAQYILTKNAEVKNIWVVYLNGNGTILPDTIIIEKYNADYLQSITNFIGDTLQNSILTSFYQDNKIQSSIEKTKSSETKITYAYNEQDNLKTIYSVSKDLTDTSTNYTVSELHNWLYNSAGKPLQMLCIKNNADTLTVNFILDEVGNVAEEHWKKKGTDIETYYYYYNNKNQLTDIVRFNKRVKKLLPDFTFDYNTDGLVTQMLQVPNNNTTDYLIWTYTYNSKNLKQQEVCINKQKQPMGKMVYVYK